MQGYRANATRASASLGGRAGPPPDSAKRGFYQGTHGPTRTVERELGTCYLLSRSPGPAASRLQSARRSFPKDDLFFREFLFAKCWAQGLHRRDGELFLSEQWLPLRDRLPA